MYFIYLYLYNTVLSVLLCVVKGVIIIIIIMFDYKLIVRRLFC